MEMRMERLSFDGEHWTDVNPTQMDNEAEVSKVMGGYAATRGERMR